MADGGDTRVTIDQLPPLSETKSLLEKISTNLPTQLAVVAPEETYEVERVIEKACLEVTKQEKEKECKLKVVVTLRVARNHRPKP